MTPGPDVDARLAAALDALAALVAIPSLPGAPNGALLDVVEARLGAAGIETRRDPAPDGLRANLIACIGPAAPGGVILNGHTDVVPVTGQTWSGDPFRLRVDGGRAIARGAVDMKGFLACCLAMAPVWTARPLARPIHLALTFDEEIGGFGAAQLCDRLEAFGLADASACVVGEPTGLDVVVGAKGGLEMRAEITGRAAHAADPRAGVNAISAAARLIATIDTLAATEARDGGLDGAAAGAAPAFDPPYATLNVGRIEGGAARNALAADCAFDWEIRPARAADSARLLCAVEAAAAAIAAETGAEIQLRREADVPPLVPSGPDDPAAALAGALSGSAAPRVVSFGADAGWFQRAGVPSVICGPGAIDQAHKPDEFITLDALTSGLAWLDRLGDRLIR